VSTYDTRDGRHALSSTSRTGLAQQSSIYIPGCPPWKAGINFSDEADDKGTLDEKTPLERLCLYNAEDCVRTAQVAGYQQAELAEADERTHLIYRQMRRLSRVASEMSRKGFPFDRSQQKKLRVELTKTFEREKQVFKRMLGKHSPAFRISDKGGLNESDFRALLFKDFAKPGIRSFDLTVPLSDKSWTDSGAPSVDRQALLTLFSQPNTPPEVQELIRQAWRVDAPLKLRSTYIDSEKVEQGIGPDGRMHARINSCGPETYRWSCSKPNLFNLSEAKDEDALQGDLPNVRSQYVADPGHVIVHRDFKQLELEVMAEYTGDALLRKMLDSGDVHVARVREWFKVPPEVDVPPALRKGGKYVGFSSQYGAGLETVWITVLAQWQGAKFEEIASLWQLFRDSHVGIRSHWQTSTEFAERNGYNEAPIMGYRRYYPQGFAFKPTECSNYAIQSGAAAIANCTMVGNGSEASYRKSLHYRLKKEFPRAYLMMHVYDSFDVHCRKEVAEEVNQLVDECMSGPWAIGSNARRYRSDGKIGQLWSEV